MRGYSYEKRKQAEVNAAVAGLSRELTAEVVVEQMRRGACFDVRKLFDAQTGDFKGIHKLTEEEAFCLGGVEFVRGNINKGDGKFDDVFKIRFASAGDRARFVEMGAKYHALLVDRVKVEDDRPLRDKVAKARARLAAAVSKGKG